MSVYKFLFTNLCLISFLLINAISANAHGGNLSEPALQACEDKKRSQECKYEGHHDDLYIGTCQYVSEDILICVRNKPIQHLNPNSVNSRDPSHEH